MSSSLVVVFSAAMQLAQTQPQLSVGVLPIAGEANAAGAIIDVLQGYDSLRTVSLENPAAVLGPQVATQLAACVEDRCLVAATSAVGTDRLIAGEVRTSAQKRVLRLRLIDSSTTAAPTIARVSQTVDDAGAGALRAAVIGAMTELFVDLGGDRFGELTVRADVEGASVWVDGKPVGLAPVGPLRMATGAHEVRVQAPGHAPFGGTATVEVGQQFVVQASLSKNRSQWPLILGAGAIGAATLGMIFGLNADSIASTWDDGCTAGRCSAGFTRARYDEDESSAKVRSGVANGMFGLAIGLTAAAVTWFIVDPGTDPDTAGGAP